MLSTWRRIKAAPSNGRMQIQSATRADATHVSFLVLNEGRVWFEGSAEALRESTDAYLRHFLFKTLPPW